MAGNDLIELSILIFWIAQPFWIKTSKLAKWWVTKQRKRVWQPEKGLVANLRCLFSWYFPWKETGVKKMELVFRGFLIIFFQDVSFTKEFLEYISCILSYLAKSNGGLGLFSGLYLQYIFVCIISLCNA